MEKIIIMLNKEYYDVTDLSTRHAGGNIFVNGQDMTQVFVGNHGTSFIMLEKYKIPKPDNLEITPTYSEAIKPKPTTSLDQALQEELEDL